MAQVRPGDAAAVFGLQAEGLAALQALRLAGARAVAFDADAERRALAQRLGAEALAPGDRMEAVEVVFDLLGEASRQQLGGKAKSYSLGGRLEVIPSHGRPVPFGGWRWVFFHHFSSFSKGCPCRLGRFRT